MTLELKTPKDVQKELAGRFKARRLALNLTQEGLAVRSGVTLSSLKRFERTNLIALAALLKLAMVLDCLGDFDRVCVDDGQGLGSKSLDEILREPKRPTQGTGQMTYAPTELLTVYLEAGERRKVGRLALRQRLILFEYDPSFIASGILLSPIKLPLKSGVVTAPDMIFDGLFGVFNDSLPDGWGRLLLDRTVEKYGVRRGQLNALDRLAYVGRNGMGALSYEPDRSQYSDDDKPLALDRLAEESAIMLAGESEEVFEELLRLNGSSAGARPKIVVQVSADKSKVIHGQAQLKPGYEHWMIKFANSQDPRDIGAIEYAYSLMARDACIDMPETHLFRTKKRAYFGVKRFDRTGDKRIHMHSLSGLIHADHRTPTLDYNLLLRVVLVLTKNILEVEKSYALACFNVLAHNRDDHAKNFSFLMNDDHAWIFAPAYDLTFSDGPAGEQSTMVMGEGKNPGVEQLTALAKEHDLKNGAHILATVQKAVARWRDHAAEAGVTAKSTKEIASGLQDLVKRTASR